MDSIKIDGAVVYQKIQKIYDTWANLSKSQAPDALVVVIGKVGEDELQLRNSSEDFILWLLQYQYSDCIIVFTKKKVTFAVSPKKKALLDAVSKPDGYTGPAIETVLKELKMDKQQVEAFCKSLLDKNLRDNQVSLERVSIFQKAEKVDGPLSQAVVDYLKGGAGGQVQNLEMRDFMAQMNKVKIAPEQANLKMAANFVEWSVQKITQEVENCIEGAISIKNAQIATKIEKGLDNPDKIGKFTQKYGVPSEQLDYPLPILVQSAQAKVGKNAAQDSQVFSLNKYTVSSDKNELESSLIFVNVCGKYIDMNAMACRTILINPSSQQKATYQLCYEANHHLQSCLKVGTTLAKVHKSTRDFIASKDASMVDRLHANFGFGIGLAHKEDVLAISEANDTVTVQPGMIFHVRITFKENISSNEKGGKELTVAAIGDTVMVTADGVSNLTEKIPSKYQHISYTLDDDEDEENQEPNTNKHSNGDSNNRDDTRHSTKDERIRERVLDARTRGERAARDNQSKGDYEKELKASQRKLHDAKIKEITERHKRNEIVAEAKKQRVKDLGKIQSYSSLKRMPQGMKQGQVFIDEENFTILVPVNQEQFVPFHVGTINNVTKSSEGQWTYLRINFHTPSPGKSASLQFPDLKNDPKAVYVKELMLKNSDPADRNHLSLVDKKIKDLIKILKTKDQEDEDKFEDEANNRQYQQLRVLQGRRDMLENVIVKPNLEGKKSIGNLELHQNGVRYSSSKGLKLDITFQQIKHAFFQPCASDELVTIIHFTLKTPLTLSNKKVYDVQFFKESGAAADDIDMRGARRRMNDLDELEQEDRERQAKVKLSDRFFKFARLIDNQANAVNQPINMDMPLEELFFTGCPHKSSVKIRPTQRNCMIAISEFPPFVIDVNDIEAVCFERVSFGTKNFDMAIIFKDFMKFLRINSMPRECIDELKEYLDSIGIIFSESAVPLNWTAVLQKIRNDVDAFIEGGAWKFLQDDEDGDGADPGEGSSEDDPEFTAEEDDEDASDDDSESDYSDDEDEDEDESDASASDEESAADWDEMDRKALEEDKKAAQKRAEQAQARAKAGRGAPARRR